MFSPRCKKILTIILIQINIMVAIVTMLSAYGGAINPDISTIPSILAMTFPAWLILTLLLIVIDLIAARKTIFIPIISVVASLPAIHSIIPLNLPSSPKATTDNTFSFLTYNVFQLVDWPKRNSGIDPRDTWHTDAEAGLVNPTVSFILSEAPDVACFQEMPPNLVNPQKSAISWLLFNNSQADSLATILPNRTGVDGELVMSRFPMRPVALRQPQSTYSAFSGAILNIHGHEILVISVHLESIGLSPEDKELYQELTEGEARSKSDLGRVRRQLLSKLSHAFRERASQARLLRQQIDSINIPDVIIAGDFNDIPGCYAIRTLCGNDFHTAFTDAGTISLPTYHANRFYFHIDHILYRGNLKAISYSRPSTPYSDHYPVLTTFRIL